MILSDVLKGKIRSEARVNPEMECCGLILLTLNGEEFRPCRNMSRAPSTSFLISEGRLEELKSEGQIIGIYHSHLNKDDNKPSEVDQLVSEKVNLPSIIYCLPTDEFCVYEPKGQEISLLNRPYFRGVFDCYSLVKDYYKRNLNIELPDMWMEACRKSGLSFDEVVDRLMNIDSDDQETKNKATDDYRAFFAPCLLEHGFKNVDSTQKNDIIIIKSDVTMLPVHVMVYIGNNTVIHHPIFKRSVQMTISPKSIRACQIFRHPLLT